MSNPMKHYLFFLRAKGDRGAALCDWFLNEAGPKIAASEDCSALRVNIRVDPPNTDPLYRNEAREGEDFDLSLDLSCPDSAAFGRLMQAWRSEIDARTEANYGYDVELLVEKDEGENLKGNPAPGYKIMRGFFFFDDLTPEAARRCWDNHVKLALRIHGFDRYVRYWVNAPVTAGAPAIGGSTNLQFSSGDTVLERYFTAPDGMTQIQQDVGHFIARGLSRLFAREHILK